MAIIYSSSAVISLHQAFPIFRSRISAAIAINVPRPSVVLRLPCPSSSFSAFLLRPISSNTCSTKSLSATTQQKYVYPDPIPEFAEAETQKFRGELLRKLSKNKESFGDDLDKVVKVCAEILKDFLYKEYGGPGTLLLEPFTDMLVVLKEKKLPGAPVAARAALLWAQNYLDKDWEAWNSQALN